MLFQRDRHYYPVHVHRQNSMMLDTHCLPKQTFNVRRPIQEQINESAVGSLDEGLEETLTLHRLGMYPLVGRSLKTTNILESVNAQAEERCGRVDHWKNSNQKHRWLAAALLDIEPRLRRLSGYRHLPALREAIRIDLKIKTAENGGEIAA